MWSLLNSHMDEVRELIIFHHFHPAWLSEVQKKRLLKHCSENKSRSISRMLLFRSI